MSTNKGMIEDCTKKYQLHSKDTGSADVQIAILTGKIEHLVDHLKQNPKDQSSRLALIICVGQRRKLLDYLKQTATERYKNLIKKLDLRK
jgi:small subunit ribosomal protein S15